MIKLATFIYQFVSWNGLNIHIFLSFLFASFIKVLLEETKYFIDSCNNWDSKLVDLVYYCKYYI